MRVSMAAVRGALSFAFALACVPALAQAQSQPTATATPRPATLPTLAPVGPTAALPTLAPANTLNLPYPAYGTPAPGQSPKAQAGVPSAITLDQAVAIAIAQSPSLASARADEALAAAPLSLAQSALFPSVSGSLSTTRSYRQGGGGSSSAASSTGSPSGTSGAAGVGFGWVTSNGLSTNLRQLIYDGGKVRAQIAQARQTDVAAIDTYRRAVQAVSFSVANAYYNALAAQRQTAIAFATVNLNQVQESLVTAQYRAGAAARADIATAQLPVAQARLALIRAQGSELAAYAQFANAMGLDANTDVRPQDNSAAFDTAAVNSIPIPSYDAAIARAYLLRPDYDASQRAIEAARYALRAARLGYSPVLSGTASAGTGSTDTTGGAFRNSSSLGLALSIPIFDQGVTRAQTAQAQANLDKAQAQFELARQGIQLAVKQGLIGLISARAGIDQANAELIKAGEVLRSTQAQYRAGVTTLPLLLNAQVGYTQALTDQATALYTLRQAEQTYVLATGELSR